MLRVTDVESRPFRSMGFVSVIIVSALFTLGLPLVLVYGIARDFLSLQGSWGASSCSSGALVLIFR